MIAVAGSRYGTGGISIRPAPRLPRPEEPEGPERPLDERVRPVPDPREPRLDVPALGAMPHTVQ